MRGIEKRLAGSPQTSPINFQLCYKHVQRYCSSLFLRWNLKKVEIVNSGYFSPDRRSEWKLTRAAEYDTSEVKNNFKLSLGPSVVRHFLPKMLGLWASAFPPTPDEAESEKSKGDPCTWQVTLECRSGALAGMGFSNISGGLIGVDWVCVFTLECRSGALPGIGFGYFQRGWWCLCYTITLYK